MDKRAQVPVSFPSNFSNPTKSYWQDPPDPELADYLSDPTGLPTDEVIGTVIIGSGITGAAIAWGVLNSNSTHHQDAVSEDEGEGKWKVIMLEARQTCSGATGRNGGHTKAASYRSFKHHLQSTLSSAEAAKIASLELQNIQQVHQFIRENQIPCENWEGSTVDIVYSETEWQDTVEGVDLLTQVFGDDAKEAEYTLYNPEETRKKFRVSDTQWEGKEETVKGAVRYYAGSLSAYKFTCGLIKKCLERKMGLWTGTCVAGLEKEDGEDGLWNVKTERGEVVKAKRVILATNGYTAALLPQKFQGVIVPLRGQITAQRPGSNMPKEGLDTTYSFIYDGGYEYMVSRQTGIVDARFEGDMIMGGGLVRGEKSEGGMNEFGITNDSELNKGISEYLKETTVRYFGKENWGEDEEEGRIRKEWTGIMGFSPDGFPLVGEVPGEKGLWVSASFQGHGMVLCWMCAKALVEMMEEGSDGSRRLDGWFPRSFRITEERLKKRFEGRFS
ncbi:putative fad dependent oxidoreductase [Podospora fimiseda]|uniref:Fad dependent oxidoreductase n=1 Tax=Podospora fimiseda TaxID=252190 RepID=A0AAN7BVD6_9PEZI|nr:putative fad dependent oxidoreductase [Podospora fimiseda]